MFLVVEDQPPIARAIERSVKSIATTVQVAGTVEQALSFIRSAESMTAATIDLGLPDGSGLQVLAEIRRRFPTVPCLVLTGSEEKHLVNQAQLLRAEFAYKPDFAANLAAFARRVAEGKSAPKTEALEAALDAFAKEHTLTTREREVLGWLVLDVPREEIPELIGLSANTLKSHVRSILKKSHRASMQEITRSIRSQTRG